MELAAFVGGVAVGFVFAVVILFQDKLHRFPETENK
jgi:tetrahydromethanopterin S-methyltransferase subunit F